jgi:hypothetical protein
MIADNTERSNDSGALADSNVEPQSVDLTGITQAMKISGLQAWKPSEKFLTNIRT